MNRISVFQDVAVCKFDIDVPESFSGSQMFGNVGVIQPKLTTARVNLFARINTLAHQLDLDLLTSGFRRENGNLTLEFNVRCSVEQDVHRLCLKLGQAIYDLLQ